MSSSPQQSNPVVVDGHQTVDIREVDDWKQEPVVSFGQMASLTIARWVIVIFGGVYLLSFVVFFVMLFVCEKVTYEQATELVKFLLQSILPLMTLVVGYYLGDKSSSSSAE